MARPLKFTVSDVEGMIESYFANTPESKQTVTGLALLFGSKQTLADYEKREVYRDMIVTAKLRIENIYEQELRGKFSTGAIFALKNFGWIDKQAIDHTTGGDKFSGFEVVVIDKTNEAADINN